MAPLTVARDVARARARGDVPHDPYHVGCVRPHGLVARSGGAAQLADGTACRADNVRARPTDNVRRCLLERLRCVGCRFARLGCRFARADVAPAGGVGGCRAHAPDGFAGWRRCLFDDFSGRTFGVVGCSGDHAGGGAQGTRRVARLCPARRQHQHAESEAADGRQQECGAGDRRGRCAVLLRVGARCIGFRLPSAKFVNPKRPQIALFLWPDGVARRSPALHVQVRKLASDLADRISRELRRHPQRAPPRRWRRFRMRTHHPARRRPWVPRMVRRWWVCRPAERRSAWGWRGSWRGACRSRRGRARR